MTLKDFFDKEKIYEVSLLLFEEAEITDERRKEKLLEGFNCQTVVAFLIPYLVKSDAKSNISKYAFAEDYHYYFKELCARLEEAFPNSFRYACDTSPINEVAAAVKSGLGSIGKNGLLINRRYGSYVFVAEFFSDLPINSPLFAGIEKRDKGHFCRECNACIKACPTNGITDKKRCVSFINQKKQLDENEIEVIKKSRMVWGCDICQDVCPENEKAEESEIEFFRTALTPYLDIEILETLVEEELFSKRAYAWRGEKTVRRNIDLLMGDNSDLPKN